MNKIEYIRTKGSSKLGDLTHRNYGCEQGINLGLYDGDYWLLINEIRFGSFNVSRVYDTGFLL